MNLKTLFLSIYFWHSLGKTSDPCSCRYFSTSSGMGMTSDLKVTLVNLWYQLGKEQAKTSSTFMTKNNWVDFKNLISISITLHQFFRRDNVFKRTVGNAFKNIGTVQMVSISRLPYCYLPFNTFMHLTSFHCTKKFITSLSSFKKGIFQKLLRTYWPRLWYRYISSFFNGNVSFDTLTFTL